MKKVPYRTKQGFILVTRDGIAHSYDHCKTCLIDFSSWGLILMQAFLYQAIYIIASTDFKVPRRYFVQNLQQYWFLRHKISASADIYQSRLSHRSIVEISDSPS